MVTGTPETGPDKFGETLRMQGRDQLDRKANILEGPYPGMQTFIHLFIYSPNNYSVPSMCQSVPDPANTAGNKMDKNPCFRGVYSLIRQTNKINKT